MATQLMTILFGLFAIVNPFGAMPVFVSLTHEDPANWKKAQALRGCIVMVVILMVFYLAGVYILDFFGLSIDGIRVVGGIIVMKAGYELFHSKNERQADVMASGKRDISFSPLAMPLLSGPGAMAFMLSISAEPNGNWTFIWAIISVLFVAVATYFILILSPKLLRYLGKDGMEKIAKMAGFITMAVGTQMILAGLKAHFQ